LKISTIKKTKFETWRTRAFLNPESHLIPVGEEPPAVFGSQGHGNTRRQVSQWQKSKTGVLMHFGQPGDWLSIILRGVLHLPN
jgi:hypothetical protein